MLLRKQAIKENFTFPPHLTSASPLLGETVDTVSTDVLRAERSAGVTESRNCRRRMMMGEQHTYCWVVQDATWY